METKTLTKFYSELFVEYGDPVKYWPQWCASKKTIEEREKVVIGMVLVQRTSWHNANIALKNLKRKGLLSVAKIAKLKTFDKLTQLIRPAGFYQSKPKRLFDICTFITDLGGVERIMGMDANSLRQHLLDIKGVGQETADTILLYAFDKPVFIIDEYTRRWVEKNGLTKEKDYSQLQKYFHQHLEPNLAIYQNFHAFVIICQRGGEKSVMEVV